MGDYQHEWAFGHSRYLEYVTGLHIKVSSIFSVSGISDMMRVQQIFKVVPVEEKKLGFFLFAFVACLL